MERKEGKRQWSLDKDWKSYFQYQATMYSSSLEKTFLSRKSNCHEIEYVRLCSAFQSLILKALLAPHFSSIDAPSSSNSDILSSVKGTSDIGLVFFLGSFQGEAHDQVQVIG